MAELSESFIRKCRQADTDADALRRSKKTDSLGTRCNDMNILLRLLLRYLTVTLTALLAKPGCICAGGFVSYTKTSDKASALIGCRSISLSHLI